LLKTQQQQKKLKEKFSLNLSKIKENFMDLNSNSLREASHAGSWYSESRKENIEEFFFQ